MLLNYTSSCWRYKLLFDKLFWDYESVKLVKYVVKILINFVDQIKWTIEKNKIWIDDNEVHGSLWLKNYNIRFRDLLH